MLTAKNVSKTYPDNTGAGMELNAVSDVTVEIPENSVTVIVGESGSGKSTLARMLSYIERPDIGRIFLDDTEITALRPSELRKLRGKVQLVMQDAAHNIRRVVQRTRCHIEKTGAYNAEGSAKNT